MEKAVMDQRAALKRLITERREDYAGLSRLIGRNSAYIQQFITRGSPKRLKEEDARVLARYLQVPESQLGIASSAPAVEQASGLILVPRYDVGASAGFGALDGSERATAHLGFSQAWLKKVSPSRPENLSIIGVQGDSMLPALADGDEIMVDQADAADRLRDGIYVLRRDDTLLVKRLAMHPGTRKLTVSSDNPAYPSWTDCAPADLVIVGRVVWAGRKIS